MKAGLDTMSREDFQTWGDKLDDEGVDWFLEPLAAKSKTSDLVVLDAIRKEQQIDAIRDSWLFKEFEVVHIHLTASADVLRQRFADRQDTDDYDAAKEQDTEKNVPSLEATADLVIRTDRTLAEDVLARALSKLGYRRNHDARLVDVVVGAQYGSEGKGHIVAHIAHEYDVLIRVGGANAGHTVLVDGKKVVFKLLPSGTLHAPHAKIVCGPGMNIDLGVLFEEIKLLEDDSRLFIDPQANIVLDADKEIEAGGNGVVGKVGSTGQGVGAATARRITDRGKGTVVLARDVPELQKYLKPTLEILDEAFARGQKVMLEGTQGTGLSLYHGPYPYVTSRDTTVSGCMAEAGIPPSRIRKVILVVRTNPIRVQSPEGGTSGPMRQELSWEDVSLRAGVPADELRVREKTTTTKRLRRVAEFDWTLLQQAVSLNGPTDIALTFTDYVDESNQNARRFEQLSPKTIAFIREIEEAANCPVSLITTRFHQRSIIDRRAW